jgi:hypothetical protein
MIYRPNGIRPHEESLDAHMLAEGKTLDEIQRLPWDSRRDVLRKYLVQDGPTLIQEPIAASNEESIRRFMLLNELLKDDHSRQNLLLEVRGVFYEEGSFIVSSENFELFLDDMLGQWGDATPVAKLVRHLIFRVKRDECQCGQLLEFTRQLCGSVVMPQLQKVSFEWLDVLGEGADDLPHSESLSSDCTFREENSIYIFSDDGRTDDSDDSSDSSDTLTWDSSDNDDGFWRLEESIEG